MPKAKQNLLSNAAVPVRKPLPPAYGKQIMEPYKPKHGLRHRILQHRTLYLLFIPVFAYFVLFKYWPIAMAWIVAFKELQLGSGVFDSPWVGLQNFRDIFGSPDIPNVIRNTIEISLLRLLFGFFPPILLAIMFHDMVTRRLKKWLQTFVYIPHFFSWVIVFGVVFGFFSVGAGFVNNMLDALGFARHEFLLDANWFRPILIGSALWKEVGWSTIIYLAALATVDAQLYEAAVLDGAGPLKRIRYITLPSIMPVVTFVLCINLGFLLNAGGEQVLLFYNDAVMDRADIIDTWVYREGLARLQFSIAAAVGLFQSVIGLALVVICNAFAKKISGRGIW
ncbi:ABC transporter permease [Paenibacillus sacheonensis]|uniref:ABC transporter permease subunit n=1 Tax=Paenibacillus sacheonensis TaxID=742054 RepID=A0A7X5C163_9BACL|nr:ABC transporter permease subunit [Paenibacillus sacheonensis]MBM7568520.1 putative aldouronate transport system permease protein [Paenibacillus sacheonensis]NBC72346.1 ABC transporter permease subunit [Paenibacillus sacheonensis]